MEGEQSHSTREGDDLGSPPFRYALFRPERED